MLDSCLNYFRKLVKLRKSSPVLIYGKYTLLDKDNPSVYAYTRELDGKKMLVLLNFKSTTAHVTTGFKSMKNVFVGNYSTPPSAVGELRPYEAVVYEVQ
jgi:oligo-1,6-glucosidase